MNWKGVIMVVLIVMLGIYVLKWVNKQYPIPVLGNVIEEV